MVNCLLKFNPPDPHFKKPKDYIFIIPVLGRWFLGTQWSGGLVCLESSRSGKRLLCLKKLMLPEECHLSPDSGFHRYICMYECVPAHTNVHLHTH